MLRKMLMACCLVLVCFAFVVGCTSDTKQDSKEKKTPAPPPHTNPHNS